MSNFRIVKLHTILLSLLTWKKLWPFPFILLNSTDQNTGQAIKIKGHILHLGEKGHCVADDVIVFCLVISYQTHLQ